MLETKKMMEILVVCLTIAGCSGSPPKPPVPDGDYRPVNRPVVLHQDVFDFRYKGDILGALPALKRVVPNLEILPVVGQPTAVPVQINLHATTLEGALRAIGEKGGDNADVVWNTTPQRSAGLRNEVYILFRPSLPTANTKRGTE